MSDISCLMRIIENVMNDNLLNTLSQANKVMIRGKTQTPHTNTLEGKGLSKSPHTAH